MGKNRWERFHNTLAVDVSTPNIGAANILADWERASQNRGAVQINGVDLSQYRPLYNNFQTEENLSKFLGDVILQDMRFANDVEKNKAIDYLKTSFHQGGFMNPVSSSLSIAMRQKMTIDKWQNGNKIFVTEEIPVAVPRDLKNEIRIVTTSTGFKVQEQTEAESFMLSSDYIEQNQLELESPVMGPDKNPPLMSDERHPLMYKAQATLDVNLTDLAKKNHKPTVTVESSTINYGSTLAEKLLDKRSLGQIIVDFFKSVLGLNTVEELKLKEQQHSVATQDPDDSLSRTDNENEPPHP